MTDLKQRILKAAEFRHKSYPLSSDFATQEYYDTINWAGEKENSRLRPLIEALAEAANILQGCSDGNCVLRDRDGGQHTNGGCRCKRNAKTQLANLERVVGS